MLQPQLPVMLFRPSHILLHSTSFRTISEHAVTSIHIDVTIDKFCQSKVENKVFPEVLFNFQLLVADVATGNLFAVQNLQRQKIINIDTKKIKRKGSLT